MANLIRTVTRNQLTNRNVSTLSHINPFFSSGSSLDPKLSSGFGLFGDGLGLNPSNEGFRVDEKVTQWKRLGFDPFLSSGSFSDLNLTSGFGLFRRESNFGDGVGVGFGLNPSNEGLRVKEEDDYLKRFGLHPFLSSGSYLDPGLAYGFGLSEVIGSWGDDVEDPGMMWADSVKKKRKKKMNKHKYKKLRKRLRRKTKT